jgi:hypothetical protein
MTKPEVEDRIKKLYFRPLLNLMNCGITRRDIAKKMIVMNTVTVIPASDVVFVLTSPVAIARATQRITSWRVAVARTIFAKVVLIIVRVQDIVNTFGHEFYLVEGSGHRERW